MENKELLNFLDIEGNGKEIAKEIFKITVNAKNNIEELLNNVDNDKEQLGAILNEIEEFMQTEAFKKIQTLIEKEEFQQKEIFSLLKEIQENGIKRKCFEILEKINKNKKIEGIANIIPFEDLEKVTKKEIDDEYNERIENIKIKGNENGKRYALVVKNYKIDGSLIQDIDGLKCFLLDKKYYQIVNIVELNGKKIFISYDFDEDEYCLCSFDGENIQYLNR